MKLAIALVAAVLAAPLALALALTAFVSGLVQPPHDLPALPDEHLGT